MCEDCSQLTELFVVQICPLQEKVINGTFFKRRIPDAVGSYVQVFGRDARAEEIVGCVKAMGNVMRGRQRACAMKGFLALIVNCMKSPVPMAN